MPYTSSIQTLNDANGSAYAFLEDNGLLWQCQWNPQAQCWDKAQVVPGSDGGEKLQALLVDNLWPTSGRSGGQQGNNTPGIVLAYRVGEGDGAAVYATLGRWGSDGQLSWSEPLKLSDSGTAIEEIALAANGAGGFQLVVKAREPVATADDAAAQGDGVIRRDSELTSWSFDLSGNELAGYDLCEANSAVSSAQPISTAVTAAPTASPAQSAGGNGEFSRGELLLQPIDAESASFKSLPTLALADIKRTSWAGASLGNSSGSLKLNVGVTPGAQRVNWEFTRGEKGESLWVGEKSKEKTYGFFLGDGRYAFKSKVPATLRQGWSLALKGGFGITAFGAQSIDSSATLVLKDNLGEKKLAL